MNEYRCYMNRQEVSAELHDRLLQLSDTVEYKRKRSGGSYLKFAAVLAVVLVIGFGVWGFADLNIQKPEMRNPGNSENFENFDRNNQEFASHRGIASEPVSEERTAKLPKETGLVTYELDDPEGKDNLENLDNLNNEEVVDVSEPDDTAFVAQGPAAGGVPMPRCLVGFNYTDVNGSSEIDAALKAPDGSFGNPLGKDEITRIFWGENGKPAVDDPKADIGDFPIFLTGWMGYTISGDAYYDDSGDLWRLVIHGIKGKYSFEMVICPGQIPPDCGNYTGLETKDVLGTEVTGWRRSFDCDGDGQDEYVFGAKLMAGEYGVMFENIGSGSLIDGRGQEESASILNTMIVNHLVRSNDPDGGLNEGVLYLDHLLHTDDIPAWREEDFATLEDALAEKDFAGYLPAEAPAGFDGFRGHMNYQEGRNRVLRVGWSKGYDDVEVEVHLPEGDRTLVLEDSIVDAAVPESYDWRLYNGPICDNVPEEYQAFFYSVTFRAEDMSLELVKARMCPRDTGGEGCIFNVLHENGTVVSYRCEGVSVEYVWGLVERTLDE